MTPKALVLLLPGLGDALTASPILRRLSASGTHDIDCVTMLAPVTEYARATGVFREVYELPLLTDINASLPGLFRIRRAAYDYCFVPFPATRWQYAIVAAAAGAKRTYIHDYGGFSRLISISVRAHLVELRGGHRAAENDRLCDAASLSGGDDFTYVVPEAWKAPQTPGLIGVHTGSMMYKGNEARRWPYECFVEFARREMRERGRRLRFFVGPNEIEDGARLRRDIEGPACEIVAEPLMKAARKLSQCEVFIGNDAGFSHLAAGLGVKTITLFGMTNPVRAVPIGPAQALRTSACPPCHDEGLRGFECVRKIGFRCIADDLPVSSAIDAVEAALQSGIAPQQVAIESGFALYGKAITAR